MIVSKSIPWEPIGNMPEDRKDGRELILGQRNTLGTVDGGDGTKLNPAHPYIYHIGRWGKDGYWETQADDEGGPFYLMPSDVDYWADINPPE